MLGVGINENVIVTKVAINDKSRLTLEFKEVTGNAPKSVFDETLTAGVTDDGNGLLLNIFGFMLPKAESNGKVYSDTERIELVGKDLKKLKNQLTQILEQYVLLEKIQFAVTQYYGTGITDGASFNARILDQNVLDKVYMNMIKHFVEVITPFVANDEYAVRLKLTRQSKEKHFATIPGMFLATNPFIELMSVPKEQSRVQFTKWEIDNGYDSGAIVSKSTAEAKPTVEESNPFAGQ